MNWKVVFALLFVFVTLIYRASSSNIKDAKRKAVSLKAKLHQKIFHHHPHHHDHHDNRHHYHHHHHPHHHNNHDKHKHHHHHHHHYHHHHNPFKHYLHHSHRHRHHRHHRHHHHPHHQHYHDRVHHLHHHHHHYHHPLHQHPKQKVQPKLLPRAHADHHDNRRSHIRHPPLFSIPSKLKLHVQIKDVQSVKRDSLPQLLSNLGHNLMKLGTSMSPNQSQLEVPVNSANGLDKKGEVSHGLPVPQFAFNAEGMSSTSEVIQAHSQEKNVTAEDLEMLLHKALDGASGDYLENGSGSGSGEELTNAGDETPDSLPSNKDSSLYQNQSSPENPDRRNQTFPEEPVHDSSEGIGRYDTEYETHNTHDTREQSAEESIQGNTPDLESDGKEYSERVYDEKSRNFTSEKTGLADITDTQVRQFEQIQDNGTRNEVSFLRNHSLFDQPRRPDIKATFEYNEGNADKETDTSGGEQLKEPFAGNQVAQNMTDHEEEETETSGSGDESSTETNDDVEHVEAEGKVSEGEGDVREPPNVPIFDNDEHGSGQNIGKNGIRNAEDGEGEQGVPTKAMAQEKTFDGSKTQVPDGTIDKQTAVDVVGNQVMVNQSEAPFNQIRTKESHSQENVDAASEDKLINKSEVNKSQKPVTEETFDRGATVKDIDAYSSGDFETPATQPLRNEPERSKLGTNLDKGAQTENERLIIQDVHGQQNLLNQPDQPGQPVLNEPEEASGGQERTEGSVLRQDQSPQIDNATLSDGPSFNAAYSPAVDTEGTQLADLHGVTSPETSSEDDTDEVPVYILSTPSNEDSFSAKENTPSPVLTTPTSSIRTESTAYAEPPTLPEEAESTFSELDTPQSQDDQYTPPSERIGYQRDMLDDPVEESLETAVDSKSS